MARFEFDGIPILRRGCFEIPGRKVQVAEVKVCVGVTRRQAKSCFTF